MVATEASGVATVFQATSDVSMAAGFSQAVTGALDGSAGPTGAGDGVAIIGASGVVVVTGSVPNIASTVLLPHVIGASPSALPVSL